MYTPKQHQVVVEWRNATQEEVGVEVENLLNLVLRQVFVLKHLGWVSLAHEAHPDRVNPADQQCVLVLPEEIASKTLRVVCSRPFDEAKRASRLDVVDAEANRRGPSHKAAAPLDVVDVTLGVGEHGRPPGEECLLVQHQSFVSGDEAFAFFVEWVDGDALNKPVERQALAVLHRVETVDEHFAVVRAAADVVAALFDADLVHHDRMRRQVLRAHAVALVIKQVQCAPVAAHADKFGVYSDAAGRVLAQNVLQVVGDADILEFGLDLIRAIFLLVVSQLVVLGRLS